LLPGLEPVGVPGSLRGTAVTFNGDKLAEFDALMDRYGDELACVIMEPMRHHMPEQGFLEHIKQSAHKHGALLLFDEITIGWRLTFGGSHLLTKVSPDIAVFAKALGNGHPMGAIVGTKDVMNSAQGSFISSTYWTESVGPVAALAALKKMEKTRVWEHVNKVGSLLLAHWERLIERHKLPAKADADGFPCLGHFNFTEQTLPLKTLYTSLMLDKGYLANTAFYAMLAHTPELVDQYAESIDQVFGEMADILKRGDVEKALDGKVCHAGFKRLIN
jgi:glutamate-1-semialdehyde aminotransferase